MISGLYKILKTVFSLYATASSSESMSMEDDEDEEQEQDILMIDDNGQNDEELKLLRLDYYHKSLIKVYINKCLSKLQTYRDELLYSVIELLLNVPLEILKIKYLIPALLRSLKIGLTHIAAGELAINVLEKWRDEHFDEIKDYFNLILPNLEPYLLINKESMVAISSNDNDDDKEDEDEKLDVLMDEDDQKQEQNKNNA